jgi:hypothetical protein
MIDYCSQLHHEPCSYVGPLDYGYEIDLFLFADFVTILNLFFFKLFSLLLGRVKSTQIAVM